MPSLMEAEAKSAPEAVARQLAADAPRWAELGAVLRAAPPPAVLTIARGSSDHAAAYLAYLAMARLGRPVVSLPMSLVTLYNAPLAVARMLAVAISQSGQSPDVVETLRGLGGAGATTVALVNDTGSPLAAAASWCFGLAAGPERSVAATKSYIASLLAAARLVGHWQDDPALLCHLRELPDHLARAARADWSAALPLLAPSQRVLLVSRGLGLPIAQEAALKLKETCGLHAEAFSSAELRHGPMALVAAGVPVLVLAMRGPTLPGLVALAADLRAQSGSVLLAAPDGVPGRDLPMPGTSAPDLDPIAAVQAFYGLAAALAEARGLDPDQPPNLSKVTRTL